MSTPLVTVLTAVRNGELHLAETIESICGQSLTDWEYVIVDDASHDSTREIIAKYAAEDGRIRPTHRETSGGPYAAANEGLRASRGRYVARIDGDDLALRHRLERQVAFLEQRPRIRACASWWRRLSDSTGEIGPVEKQPTAVPGALPWLLCLGDRFAHSTMFVERAALLEIGGYREELRSQDFRMWCELARRRWLDVVPDPLIHYREHARRLTVTHSDAGLRLSKRVLRDHLEALTGQSWSPSEAEHLWYAGRNPRSLVPELRALKRLESAAPKDTLGPQERDVLVREITRVRRLLVARVPRRAALRVVRAARAARRR